MPCPGQQAKMAPSMLRPIGGACAIGRVGPELRTTAISREMDHFTAGKSRQNKDLERDFDSIEIGQGPKPERLRHLAVPPQLQSISRLAISGQFPISASRNSCAMLLYA